MPLYEYYCEPCDQVFTSLKSMDSHKLPDNCPGCGQLASRVLYTAPRLNTMRAETRKAHQVNERSAHEPRVKNGHHCGPGCHHHKNDESGQPKVKQQQGKRPWMLGH